VTACKQDQDGTGACLRICLTDVTKEPVASRITLAEFILLLLSEKISILRKIKRDIIRKVRGYSCKPPVLLVNILIKFELQFRPDPPPQAVIKPVRHITLLCVQ